MGLTAGGGRREAGGGRREAGGGRREGISLDPLSVNIGFDYQLASGESENFNYSSVDLSTRSSQSARFTDCDPLKDPPVSLSRLKSRTV